MGTDEARMAVLNPGKTIALRAASDHLGAVR
jgi:hypothetical protein